MRQTRWIGVVGDADELLDEVVGSVQQRKRMKRNVFSQELENEKRKPFKLCLLSWLIRKIQISYKLKYDNNNNNNILVSNGLIAILSSIYIVFSLLISV
jgi:hypothetical protein